MESKGSSLPSMPEPASPLSMKPPPGRTDASTDPALLMNPAVVLQDTVLQKMAGHNNNHHERLKDLTSRVLNGDQDKLPKLCSTPDTPVLKGADAPSAIVSLQRKVPSPHVDLGLKGQITHLAGEVVLSGSEEVKKRKGRALKTKPPAKSSPPTTTSPLVILSPLVTISPLATTTTSPLATTTTSPLVTTTTSPLVTTTTSPLVTTTTSPLVTTTTTSPLVTTTTSSPLVTTTTTSPLAATTTSPLVTTSPLAATTTSPLAATTTSPLAATSPSVAYLQHVPVSPWIPQLPYSHEQEVKDQEKVKVGEEMEGVKEVQQEVEAVKAVSFSVGDVVWTKVSGSPWWPCMVSTDPELEHHAKPKHRARGAPGLLYHVQYFGDCPERGYIWERSMVSFRGEDQYEELSQANRVTVKQHTSRIVHKRQGTASVPRKFRSQWTVGVSQAQEALRLPLDQRMDKFTYVYAQDGLHLNPHVVKLRPEETEARERGVESRLVPAPSGQTDEPAKHATSTGKKPAAAVERKAAKGRKAGNGVKRGSATIRRALSQANESPLSQVSRTHTSHMESSSETQGEVGETQLKRKKPDQNCPSNQNNRTKSAAGKKTLKKPPAQTALTAEQKDQQPNKKRNTGKQTDKLKAVKPDLPPQKQRRRRTTEEGAKLAKKKQKGSVSADQSPERQQRVKRKREVDNRATLAMAKKMRPSPCPESEGSGSEERSDSPGDGLDDPKKAERLGGARKELVCQVCEQPGEDMQACEGQCSGMFHLSCLGLNVKPEDKLLCQECTTGIRPCFTCKQTAEGTDLRRCYMPHCGKFYHEACARLSPLSVFDQRGLRCPLHTCLSCHLGRRSNGKATKGKMMRCLRCPVAYHVGELCVSAGSQVVSSTALVCTSHFNAKKGYSHHSHVNVSWCFVCSKGGQLLCCESCPAAFHPDCLNISMPEGSWFCNDCRAGKKPKYQDVIWVKLGTYRWWPAEVRHPRTVPTNIQHLRHQIGEFPVFFFGSKDFFWTHQGRVFPYMEGDRGSKHQKTNIGKVFKNALLEAEARFKETKLKREAKEAQENNKKPPPYKFIKVNKPCGKVQVSTADVSEIPKCNCKPSDERPCGFEAECLNRMLLYECHPQVCPSGARCCNQDFTKRLYPDTKIIKTAGKGWGLVCLRDVKKGEFVNEYVGELIDEEECRARIRYAQENNISHFYMLTIDKDRIIDAGPKGNYSRFMNHSCQPNCETQKWTVNGDTRVGLFAVCHIPAGTELTFNYNLDCLGNEKTVCRCGAPNCSGFLGDRPKTSSAAPSEVKVKRVKRRKRRSEGKRSEDECFRCGDGGQLVICGKKSCTKAYHLACLGLAKRPFGRWDCPWHHCDVCGKASEAFCQLCPNSFCCSHQDGALQDRPSSSSSSSTLLCCLEHDHQDPPLAPPLV
ncbi:unnamed protein product [Merluccius merluccius]